MTIQPTFNMRMIKNKYKNNVCCLQLIFLKIATNSYNRIFIFNLFYVHIFQWYVCLYCHHCPG